MKTKDRIKEEIGLNKLLIGIISAADFSLRAWAFNDNSSLNVKNILVYFAIFIFCILLLICYNDTTKKIKKLDEYI